MNYYSALDYLKIEIASRFGIGKVSFEDHIAWVNSNEAQLQHMVDDAKEPHLYWVAVNAYLNRHRPQGIMVGLDASASGLQILSAVLREGYGCYLTGLVDHTRPIDAYSILSHDHSQFAGMDVTKRRDDLKQAIMTAIYGSKAEPVKLFGTGTILQAFYAMLDAKLPRVMSFIKLMLDSWDDQALNHQMVAPDGFRAVNPVIQPETVSLELDYSGKSRCTVATSTLGAVEEGRANAANATHTLDG